jgi:signal transduction histidine kinase/DNA-binding NarL/FixJ family response regulator/HPt (histidine-containing phosphotransfer) domain-containing protein
VASVSIRLKTFFILIATVVVITASTLFISLKVSEYRFTETVKTTLTFMSKIASGLLSAEIGRLKERVKLTAEYLKQHDLNAMEVQMKRDSPYLALSVIGREGVILHAGDPDTRPLSVSRETAYIQRAFDGETVFTTTSYTPEENLVARILTPIDDNHVLAATLSGLYLSEILSPYIIWKTGSIFIIDNEGTAIAANQLYYRVQERHNYIDWGKRNSEYRKMGEVFQLIIENNLNGVEEYFIEQYPYEKAERYCAYDFISGTDNWSVLISAPFAESPLTHIRQMLFICTAIIMGLGVIAALLTANSISAPYEKMTELRSIAEAASVSKTRFLANMSHEMRTPLNAIIGLSELELGSAKLQGESFTNVEKIYTAGMTLLGIINDLLDISKIESGKLLMIPVIYDVPGMINDTVNLNVVRIGSKPVQFRLYVDKAMPSRLKGDELRIKQVFNNLLSNAFKYTDSGFVDWHISSVREGDQIKVVSTIRDTGIGIHKDDQEKLFKDYYQANLKANYYLEGTGLGLSITKNLVKLMGGTIKFESEYRKGSSFTVEFYQEAVSDEVIGEEAAEHLSRFRFSAQRRSRNQRLLRADMSYASVLIVDDVVSNLDVARGMLKPYKIGVECVTSGKEAINRILDGKVHYDAIFMDHMMPGMDGIQTTRIIREEINNDYAKNVPIIALTANALLGNDALFLENGFQAYLSKPIDIIRLDQILNQWVRDKKKEKEMAEKSAEKSHETKPESPLKTTRQIKKYVIPGVNTSEALERFDNDDEVYFQVLRSFITYNPKQLETLKTAGDDHDAYRLAAHSMKGSSRNIGAEDLGNQAEMLEKAAIHEDWDYINAVNADFIKAAEKLISDINDFLKIVMPNDPESKKPEKKNPDPEILDKILEACENYDIVALREAIDALAEFRYPTFPDLAQWTREQSNKSNFSVIQKRIASIR